MRWEGAEHRDLCWIICWVSSGQVLLILLDFNQDSNAYWIQGLYMRQMMSNEIFWQL